jgi:nucleotide-binding universal stress UspA family protein
MYTGLGTIEEHLPDMLQTVTPVARHLRQSVKLFVEKGIDARLELRHGSVVDEILAEARTGGYDLIIIGASRASTNLSGWLMGDVTRQILRAAPCPVLIARKSRRTNIDRDDGE